MREINKYRFHIKFRNIPIAYSINLVRIVAFRFTLEQIPLYILFKFSQLSDRNTKKFLGSHLFLFPNMCICFKRMKWMNTVSTSRGIWTFRKNRKYNIVVYMDAWENRHKFIVIRKIPRPYLIFIWLLPASVLFLFYNNFWSSDEHIRSSYVCSFFCGKHSMRTYQLRSEMLKWKQQNASQFRYNLNFGEV